LRPHRSQLWSAALHRRFDANSRRQSIAALQSRIPSIPQKPVTLPVPAAPFLFGFLSGRHYKVMDQRRVASRDVAAGDWVLLEVV
jgi:hypothetical protein